MQVIRIQNPTGIDHLKLIGETELEKSFIKQLSEAGTLVSSSTVASGSVIFKALPVGNGQQNNLVSTGKIGKLDFTIRQNSNFVVDLRFVSDTLPMDLTDYSAIKLQVRKEKGSPVLVTLTVGSGLAVSGDDNNILSVQLTPAHTATLCKPNYYYDIMFVKPGSNTYYVEGKIYIERSVTS